MDKSIKNTEQNSYNVLVIKKLAEKYDLSEYYVRQCVSGRKKGIMPDTVAKDYKELDKAVNNALNK